MAETGIYPKKPGETVYYVRRLNYMFSMPTLDEKGQKIPETNPNTGLPIRDPRGAPLYLEHSIQFTPWKTRFTEEGYVCVFVVTKDTPKPIAEQLEKDAKSRLSEVLDEESYIKQVNPDLYARIQQDAEKDSKISAQDAEIARLKQLLQGNRQSGRP